MSRAPSSSVGKLARLACLCVALVQVVWLAVVIAERLVYPLDLEWMEGGMLCHALQLLDGKSIYAPPSVDFIPFLYTPLYPALLALLAKVAGLGYVLGRAVSIASYVGASVLAYRFAATEGGSRAAAFAAMAIPAAAYVLTGAFYDLVRPDSLWLLLVTLGVLLVYRAARDGGGARRTDAGAHATAALAGLVLVLAFLTKQTASPLMLAAGAALLFLNLRLVPAFALSTALVGLPSLYLLNRASVGWFWRYVFALHQSHGFYAHRAWVEGPIALGAIVGPALLVVPWALARRASPALLYVTWIASVGAATACLASGTQWAITNAYIPGVFFPSLAIGLAAGRLLADRPVDPAPRLRPAVVFALLLASLALKLPSLDGHIDDAFLNLSRAHLYHRFDLRRFVPTAADRAAGERLLARLRATDGEVLIPFHPFYAHLAGKRTFVHQMGVMDIAQEGLTTRGLAEAIAGQRFSLVIVDDKIADKWPYWPGLRERYDDADHFTGPRVYSGAMTAPSLAMTPRRN